MTEQLSLRELRPHMPRGQNTKTKQKQYCNQFNKDFKNGPHQKKKNKRLGQRYTHTHTHSSIGVHRGNSPSSHQGGNQFC